MELEEELKVGRRVALYRGQRSQQWLADEMRARGYKWAQATAYTVEQGKRPLKFVEARDLAAVLGINITDLFGDPEIVRRQAQLREQTKAVQDAYSASVSNLAALIPALEALSESLKEANTYEPLAADVQRARVALKQTPNRALSEARKAHTAPIEDVSESWHR